MVFTSKKGMSPLIATVLLIAFAVALGAMIMNWSAGVSPEENQEAIAGCATISLTSDNGVCYAENKLSFDLRNNGDGMINKVKLLVTDSFGETETTLKNSVIIPGETIEGEKPYVYDGGAITLEFFPLIDDGAGEYVTCKERIYTQNTLSVCQ